MSVARRMKDRIVIQEPTALETGTDEYGNEDESVLGYWDAVEYRAFITPTGTSEDETDRETVQRQFDLYLDASTPITANSRVLLFPPGEENVELTCRVIGEPITHRTTTRGISHKVARVEVVEG